MQNLSDIKDYEKKDLINGERITFDNFFELYVEHVQDGFKRELTENEDRLSFFLSKIEWRYKDYFKAEDRDITRLKMRILSDLKRITDYEKLVKEFPDETGFRRTLNYKKTHNKTRVRDLIKKVNWKNEYQSLLLFLDEFQSLLHEIRFGENKINDSDYDFLKIANYGHYKTHKIKSLRDNKRELEYIQYYLGKREKL